MSTTQTTEKAEAHSAEQSAKFTPGPWTAHSDGRINAYSEPSCTIGICSGGLSAAQNAANARLIAAAPEFYDASLPIKSAFHAAMSETDQSGEFQVAEGMTPADPLTITLTVQQWERLCAVISKAEKGAQ